MFDEMLDSALFRVERLEVYFDAGTRRSNPGPSGIAVYVRGTDSQGDPFNYSATEFIGHRTNNEAEYRGLLKALELVIDHAPALRELAIRSDSKLVVKQALGEWRVRGNIKSLHARALELCQRLVDRGCHVTIEHVPRAENAGADRLVTELLDEHLGRRRGY